VLESVLPWSGLSYISKAEGGDKGAWNNGGITISRRKTEELKRKPFFGDKVHHKSHIKSHMN
jgi:hypothetical protein